MEKNNEKADTCKPCYWIASCLLSPVMAKQCGGPFKDEKHRHKVFAEFIKKK